MDQLPREILAEVLEFLVGPAPTEYRLHDQPSDGLLESEVLDLKSASQVSHLWRGQALPILFRHVQWRPELSSLDGLDPVPLLRFLVGNRLQRNVITFTLLVDFADHQIESARVAYQIRPSDLEWLWDQLFAAIDPLRFTIIAPPATLAAFLNRMLFLDDAWSFNIPYHILSLARSHRGPRRDSENMLDLLSSPFGTSSSPPGASSSVAGSFKGAVPAPPCPFLTLRPWTSILLNEGSSIRAYQTYEFFLRSPPSMLSALLGTGEYPNNSPLFPRTVVDFNYIAIFPLSSHISHLIHHLPKLDRFFVRFTPRPNNCILEDRQTLKHVDVADLWMERTTAFRHMLGEIVNDPGGGGGGSGSGSENWKTLNVFEIGEMEDAEVRTLAHTYVDRAGSGWIVTDGVASGAMVRVDEEGKAKGPSGAVVPHTLAVRHDVLHGPGWAVMPNYHFQPVL
ncbi:F-box domain-containing protein [Apiospora aurea]|uniref:F-box domain-containing protein n=1 Tax=Apiospora aurea TaxID=335848 RepID=A0ABR1Q590_9PEZI